MTGEGKGHPLPESEEARHNEIPEDLEAAKGEGDFDPSTTDLIRRAGLD